MTLSTAMTEDDVDSLIDCLIQSAKRVAARSSNQQRPAFMTEANDEGQYRGGQKSRETGFAEEYPFDSNFLDFDGLRYHYLDEGRGETLLFVHGNPTWSFAWRNLVRELSPKYRTIAVDHIGCGFSEKPQDYEYTLDGHISNLVRFIETLDLEAVDIGCARLGRGDWDGSGRTVA